MTDAAPVGDQPLAGSAGPARPHTGGGGAALLVAAGILLSRIAGFVRQRIFAQFFGASAAADAFSVAFRIPNLLQNLLGEGVLSASFIPVYAALRATGDDRERRDVASAVLWLLILVSSVVVLAGIALAPVLVDVLSPGFEGEKRELTIALVRVLYPGAALLVWSAWCLGVLNSHGRFFLSYVAPVLWNATMIVAMLLRGPGRDVSALAMDLAWASVLGSALVVTLQVPTVLRLLGRLRLTLGRHSAHVRTVLRNFGPVLLGRGVVQVSAYVDVAIASLIAGGAAAILGYAQLLYLLPVSLFGMAVTAAELPTMSSGVGDATAVARHVRSRLTIGADRIAFFVIPSAVALLAIGDLLSIILYRGGRFGASETVWVWRTLGGAAVGLVAATLGRLYASAFYAMRDTRTPVRFALVRVAVSVALGVSLALLLPRALELAPLWGVAGLTFASSVGAWLEYGLLRRALSRRLPQSEPQGRGAAKLWLAAAIAAGSAWALRAIVADGEPRWLLAVVLTGVFGVVYLAVAAAFGYQEVGQLLTRVRRKGRGSRGP